MKPSNWFPRPLTLLVIAWPAVLVLFIPVDLSETFRDWLKANFYHPPSVDHVVDFWFKSEPAWKSTYISLWFFNSIFIAIVYAVWMLRNPQHLREMDSNASWVRAVILGFSGLLMSFICYFGGVFAPDVMIPSKINFIRIHDSGLLLITPLFFVGASCAPIGAIAFFVVAWFKIERMFKGDGN